jgi:hypothetical protein
MSGAGGSPRGDGDWKPRHGWLADLCEELAEPFVIVVVGPAIGLAFILVMSMLAKAVGL